MNICFLSKSQLKSIGGIETYIDLLSEVFVKAGHNVHIITTSKKANVILEQGYLEKGINIHKIDFEYINIPGIWRIEKIIPLSMMLYSYLVYKKVKTLNKKYNFDLIESPNRAFEGLFCSFNKKIPLVVRLHGGIIAGEMQKEIRYQIKDLIIKKLEKILVSHANAITSPSQIIAKIAKDSYKIHQPVFCIPNPIDLTKYFPIKKAENRNPVILYVGRYEEAKGIFVLAEAIPEILRQFPEVYIIFIGPDTNNRKYNGSCREYLKAKINDKRVNFFSGMSRNEVIKYYQKSWICVFPSFYESFGMVALEAMACGKAIIATKIGGFCEIVEDGVSGLLISPADVKSLVNTIKKLLINTEYRKKIAENAYLRAKELFNLDNICTEIEMVYRCTINKGKNIRD